MILAANYSIIKSYEFFGQQIGIEQVKNIDENKIMLKVNNGFNIKLLVVTGITCSQIMLNSI